MFTKTYKRVKLKGRSDVIVREQYLRDDIPCHSPLCETCTSVNNASRIIQLERNATHYVIPCTDVIENYLEVFELEDIKGMVILQSITSKVNQSQGHRFFKRLINICKDIRHGSAIFLNEICKEAYIPRTTTDSLEEWLIKCCVSVAEYYAAHLNGNIPIILVTENVQAYESKIKNESIQVYSLKKYLEVMWEGLDTAIQLCESLSLALSAGSVKDLSKSYDNYLPIEVLEAGIKSGRFYKGRLLVNKHNASQEAFVASSKVIAKESGDMFICGMIDRNRAIHGDEVAVEMLPEHQWKSRCLSLVDNSYNDKGDTVENLETSIASVIPTGRIIGILERCWRNYVATLPEDEENSGSTRKHDRILVIPYDYRIPKIRIVTKHADDIRNKRVIVRIDNWDKDSQYPNGHLVKTLGEIGELETEIQSLLNEHDIFVGEFPQNLISELPVCNKKNPWTIEEEEILKRKDLRNTHLIFSIDPKGCEDVDDTLSVRDLSNGMVELGVHIADVTYFVKPLSFVDLEARSRSTSVYLPDRRYDMLPHVLSGNLCSLLGNVERYAVSVIWKFDSKFQVQKVWYGRTIIKSSYKLAYEDAQDILCNAKAEEMAAHIPELQGLKENDLKMKFEELKNAITKLYNIANNLRKERLNEGGLELNSINMKFEIDKRLPSVVSDIKSSKELAIHKTVAECMIFANHWVARKICKAFPQQAVLRRHPNPREADLAELQKLALSKGFSINIQSNRELAASLEKAVDMHDPTINQILRILATQAMNQATYFCSSSCGASDFHHYGLGLDKYTHFTSPIRRYADVLVHRLLLAATEDVNNVVFETSEIEELCNHLNIKHRAAQDVEKAAQQLFLANFVEEMTCKENSTPCIVDGIIYSLLANGMLVFVPKYGIKGAVYLRNKDKKVAVVNDSVEWLDGHLNIKDSNLIVESQSVVQKYSIFDHVTLCMKVLKSRCHQQKIVLDLLKNEPYTSDLTEVMNESLETFTSEPEIDETISVEINKTCSSSTEEFNLYLFLEKIKSLCISEHDKK